MCHQPRPTNRGATSPPLSSSSSSLPPASETDAISITPGTAFMERLSHHFQYFILRKMEQDHNWQACTVVFSGSEVGSIPLLFAWSLFLLVPPWRLRLLMALGQAPGEGEHKIMDFLRCRRASYSDYSPDELHTLYGLVRLAFQALPATAEENKNRLIL